MADLDLTFDEGESADSPKRHHRETSITDDEDDIEASGDGFDGHGSTDHSGGGPSLDDDDKKMVHVPGPGAKQPGIKDTHSFDKPSSHVSLESPSCLFCPETLSS
ncbi:hypothetical protein IscW_ISCW013411 [Ixodes scapularis]|uniref:Uncharacterized protein n=1 Tax=Ixodes scapularis TaxID=6945 RepID=B7QDC3_IXOSC|nr:hypothetical protein IscW_ISCW013411 [Ixodes scapularis]|eukprot:XP_002413537.1 hypothetical protein IscW_ISCW013411 [Ixodes scapularis]